MGPIILPQPTCLLPIPRWTANLASTSRRRRPALRLQRCRCLSSEGLQTPKREPAPGARRPVPYSFISASHTSGIVFDARACAALHHSTQRALPTLTFSHVTRPTIRFAVLYVLAP